MRNKVVVLMCMAALASIPAAAEVLFSDTYDRANNTIISASSEGMSGTLSPMTYMESFQGSGTETSIQISSNNLNVAMGPGMSCLYLNHNFTDSSILSTGGFSVSLDVLSIVTSDDAGNRFGGFGLGMTEAEAAAAGDLNDDDTDSTTMRGGGNNVAICDFFVDTALDNKLRVWNNGALLTAIDISSYIGTIKVDFAISDFNAGSSVTADVYFNGTLLTTQTFNWDNTEANYIGISGRCPSAGVFLDNLEIATIPEPATLALLALGCAVIRPRKK